MLTGVDTIGSANYQSLLRKRFMRGLVKSNLYYQRDSSGNLEGWEATLKPLTQQCKRSDNTLFIQKGMWDDSHRFILKDADIIRKMVQTVSKRQAKFPKQKIGLNLLLERHKGSTFAQKFYNRLKDDIHPDIIIIDNPDGLRYGHLGKQEKHQVIVQLNHEKFEGAKDVKGVPVAFSFDGKEGMQFDFFKYWNLAKKYNAEYFLQWDFPCNGYGRRPDPAHNYPSRPRNERSHYLYTKIAKDMKFQVEYADNVEQSEIRLPNGVIWKTHADYDARWGRSDTRGFEPVLIC